MAPMQSPSDLTDYLAVAEVVARSPGAPFEVLASTSWDMSPPAEAVDLIHRGRELQQRMGAMGLLYKPSVYGAEHAADVDYLLGKISGSLGLIAILDKQYRTIRRRWLDYRLPSYHASLQVQAEQLKNIDQINVDRKRLAEQEASARGYFGNLWRNETSDWDALDRYMAWVIEFRGLCRHYSLGQGVFNTARITSA